MDERVEGFLADVLALEGESPEAIRETVRAALADCEAVFRAQETNRRMKDTDQVIPGNNMKPYSGLSSTEERAKIIAFLEANGGN